MLKCPKAFLIIMIKKIISSNNWMRKWIKFLKTVFNNNIILVKRNQMMNKSTIMLFEGLSSMKNKMGNRDISKKKLVEVKILDF